MSAKSKPLPLVSYRERVATNRERREVTFARTSRQKAIKQSFGIESQHNLVQVCIRVTKDQRDLINELAAQADISVAALILSKLLRPTVSPSVQGV